MSNPYKVFHSTSDTLRSRIHFILVRPEQGVNVGSSARAMANMGIKGSFRIVGTPEIVDERARASAVHASNQLEQIKYFPDLKTALQYDAHEPRLTIAATARVGSPHRPHPVWVRPAMERAISKLASHEIAELILVFGPESDGLTNAEVELCDWVVTIPATMDYRSLNLAQALLVFSYEANLCLMQDWEAFNARRPSQKEKLVTHIVKLAEEVGFILPGDPFKMRPRLEEILSPLPRHIKEVRTLHGLIDQVIRSLKKGEADFKGRYKRALVDRRPVETNSKEVTDGKQG